MHRGSLALLPKRHRTVELPSRSPDRCETGPLEYREVFPALWRYQGYRGGPRRPLHAPSHTSVFPALQLLLSCAAEEGDLEIVSRLLPTSPEKSACQFRGEIVCSAVKKQQLEVVQFALKCGSIRECDTIAGIRIAAAAGYREILGDAARAWSPSRVCSETR